MIDGVRPKWLMALDTLGRFNPDASSSSAAPAAPGFEPEGFAADAQLDTNGLEKLAKTEQGALAVEHPAKHESLFVNAGGIDTCVRLGSLSPSASDFALPARKPSADSTSEEGYVQRT